MNNMYVNEESGPRTSLKLQWLP